MNTMARDELRSLSLALAAVTFGSLLAVWLGGQAIGETIGREDQLVESLSALMFLLGAVACAYALAHGRHKFWAVIWFLLCVVFMGEEVSWFQRVFGYSVPGVEGYSSQSEFNLHNLRIFGGGRILRAQGGYDLSLRALLNSQNIFRAGLLTWFVVLPLLTTVPAVHRMAARLGYLRPSLALFSPIWIVLAVAAVLTLATRPPIKDYVAEVTELGYASLILLYTLLLARTERSPVP
jgi:hypothetical protein